MRTIAVVSDSHIPGSAADLPDAFRDRIRGADHVVHAGDFTDRATLEEVSSLADGALTAVAGNMDDRGLDLPGVATLDVEAVTLVVTHGTGSPDGYRDRVAATVRDVAGPDAVGIAGHTHAVLDTVVDGVRVLNPGSVTGAAPADRATMLTVDVDEATLDVSVHEA